MRNYTIGIVGGMGSYATAYFFKRLLDAFPAEKEWDRPRILIDNNCTMPSRVRAILYDERKEELTTALSASVNGLLSLGCNVIVFGCITSHYFIDKLKIESPNSFRLVNLLSESAHAIIDMNIDAVHICCTEGTAKAHLWDSYFCGKISLSYPDENEQLRLRNYIEAVKQNKLEKSIINEFAKYINALPKKNIILACTELSVLFESVRDSVDKHVHDPIYYAIDSIKKQ